MTKPTVVSRLQTETVRNQNCCTLDAVLLTFITFLWLNETIVLYVFETDDYKKLNTLSAQYIRNFISIVACFVGVTGAQKPIGRYTIG